MPSKRQQDDLSDSDIEVGSSPPKRSRFDDDGDDGDGKPAPKRVNKKAQRRNDSDIESDSDREERARPNSDDEDDEKKEDRKAQELEDRVRQEELAKIRRDFADGRQQKGKPGTLGVIQRIELTNFMCHKRFTLKFGDQINFVTGHNGSGKSAVLTALTVALGVKASTTGRGSGMRSFIREGENVAEVEIVVKNSGPEAFKPEQYGSTITIVRRFAREGSSGYKLKGENGKVVSTKRDELLAMCEQMQLQLDNPMNVLSQDNARQFLSGTHAKEKYTLFLKGTGLQQLAQEYNEIKENIQKASRTLDQKKDSIADLREKTENARAKYDIAQRTEGDRTRLSELEAEKAWAHVDEKQKEYENSVRAVEKEKRQNDKIEENLAKEKENFETTTAECRRLEATDNDNAEETRLTSARDEITKEMKECKDVISQARSGIADVNREVKGLDSEIQDLQDKINEELAKTQDDRDGRAAAQAETARRINEKEQDIKRTEEEISTTVHDRDDAGNTEARTKAEYSDLKGKCNELQRKKEGFQQEIDQAADASKNELNRFGRSTPQILQDIDRVREWRGKKPIGPLGRYVEVRKQEWGHLMRVHIGRTMFSYVVENSDDRRTLFQILQKYNLGDSVTIIIARMDTTFNCSSGEPPQEFETPLRVLQISDPWAVQVLVTQHNIEKNILVEKREESQARLDKLATMGRPSGMAWCGNGFTVRRYAEGGFGNVPSEHVREGDPRKQLWPTRGRGYNTQEAKDQVQRIGEELREIQDRMRAIETAGRAATATVRRLNAEEQRLRASLARFKREWQELQDTLQSQAQADEPVDIAVWQESKAELESKKAELLQQLKPAADKQADATRKSQDLGNRLREINAQLKVIEQEKDQITDIIRVAATARDNAKRAVDHWQIKLDNGTASLENLDSEREVKEKELQTWTAEAAQWYKKFDRPRKLALVEKDILKLKQQIASSDKARGYTLEEARLEVHQTQLAFDKAQKEISDMTSLVNKMKTSLDVRLNKWELFRAQTSIRTKEIFQQLLSKRGYSGTIDLKHGTQELDLRVRTDDQAALQGATQTQGKDPRALSGGEKSYSTVCLLMALWRSLECPLRCLDEFDVFMDNVNRRVSMNLMIEEAKSSTERQHILLSPLDISHVPLDNTIKVHRLGDPERGQGVLATGAGHRRG